MPQIRMQDVHRAAARALKRGELPVTETGDNRHLRHPPRRRGGILDSPATLGLLDGDLLVYGWKPLLAIIGGLGLYMVPGGLGALLLYALDAGVRWGWQGLVMTPLGFWMLVWYPFVSKEPRLVIFDRRRGLVHLPRWLSRRYDAVRFEDLTVLIADIPAGYNGLRRMTCVHVAQPGRSLWRREHPPWYRRICLEGSYPRDDKSERSWRAIVEFMTQPREAVDWAVEESECQAATVELRYSDSWARMRWAMYRRCRRFYGSELLVEPNWGYDAEGRWQRLPEGERERVVLPDGPEDKRVPVTLRERAPRRWLRALWAGRS